MTQGLFEASAYAQMGADSLDLTCRGWLCHTIRPRPLVCIGGTSKRLLKAGREVAGD